MSRRQNLLRLAEALFPVAPRAALSLVTHFAPRVHPPTAQPTDQHILYGELVKELLGPAPPSEIERILRRSAAARYRGIVLRRAVERRGLGAALPLVRWHGREQLEELQSQGRGACFTTWHAGPTFGIWAGLAGLGLPLLKFQVGERFPSPPNWEFMDPDQEGAFKAPALKRALIRLRSGCCVAVPADMYQWSPRVILAESLGRRVALSPVIPLLAKLGPAPVIPLFAWWSADGRAIEVEVQKPLNAGKVSAEDSPEFEAALAADLARRVEQYLRDHPDEYDGHYARMFVKHERVSPE